MVWCVAGLEDFVVEEKERLVGFEKSHDFHKNMQSAVSSTFYGIL